MRHRSSVDRYRDTHSSVRDSEIILESRSRTIGITALSSSAESDPAAIKDLFSKAGKKLYFQHIPQTEGIRLVVKYAGDDAPESD